MDTRPKIGLALGGGGARGFAHVGVLKVLEREGIPVDLIVGTSMGALVGAAYALKPDAAALEARISEFFADEAPQNRGLRRLEKIHPFNLAKTNFMHRLVRIAEKHLFLSLAMLKKALVSEEEVRETLRVFLPDVDTDQTTIPYAAVAADLVSGRGVVLREGSLIEVVLASCAVPGFMAPVRREEMILADGAVVERIPTNPATFLGAEIVIGVDAGFSLCRVPPIEDGIDAINRAMEIMSFYLNRRSREKADILIEPSVKQFEWTDFFCYEDIIREGERAAESKIEEIKALLRHGFRRKMIRKFFKGIPWAKKITSPAGDLFEGSPDWVILEKAPPGTQETSPSEGTLPS
ncbi:MAG: patatin-like phospholipase family protein [Deltaproteobacteria bacterium]|nr:patatin-like phospholipase family protein [Deltaproteobacteria bacterium]